MSQWLIDCSTATRSSEGSCTVQPYTAPPATVDHYSLGPTWGLWVAAGLLLFFVIAVAAVRWKAHAEKGESERVRILNPPKYCPTCATKLETT
jgi:hypothetical protein